MSDWRDLAAVAAGGAIGSSLRYLIGLVALSRLGPYFPWGTLFINVAGSLAIGLVGELAVRHVFGAAAPARLFLMVGVLGGFTTFSAFSLEAMGLFANRPFAIGAFYVAASVVFGIAACSAGVALGRALIHL